MGIDWEGEEGMQRRGIGELKDDGDIRVGLLYVSRELIRKGCRDVTREMGQTWRIRAQHLWSWANSLS